MSNRKILQIIPCEPGWYARTIGFREDLYVFRRLCAFGLTSEGNLVGLEIDEDYSGNVEDLDNFDGYEFRPEHTTKVFAEDEDTE